MTVARERAFNTHHQLTLAGGGVAIVPARLPTGSYAFCGWRVYRVNSSGAQVVTDPTAAWYDRGCKVFSSYSRGSSAEALAAAQAWVAETYGEPGPWSRNRQGDYLPTRIHKAFPLRPRGAR